MPQDVVVKRVGLTLAGNDSIVVRCAVQMFDFDQSCDACRGRLPNMRCGVAFWRL